MEKKESKGKKICHSDREFEELFLPGSHEKKKMQEAINEPGKLTEHLTENFRSRPKK
jgi:hypothetical protein